MTAGRQYPSRPIVAIGMVVLRPGHVLLVRRAHPPNAGTWSLPGGAQELGETAEECARRELAEETGVTVGALQLCVQTDFIHRDPDGRLQFHYMILDFCARATGTTLRAADDAAEARWAPFDDLATYRLRSEALRAVTTARRILEL